MLCISNMEYSWTKDQKEMRMRKMGWIPPNEKKLIKELEDAMEEGEKLFQENQKLKKELEKWDTTYSYISKQHTQCMEPLYKEIYELKQEIKKLKKDLNHLF